MNGPIDNLGGTVSIIQSTALEAQGLLHDRSSSLEIQGRWFEPGPSFKKSLCQIAIEFCEDACAHGKQYILIEFPSYLMTWRYIRSTKPASSQSTRSSKVEKISFTSPNPLQVPSVPVSPRNVLPAPPEIATHQALGIANIDNVFVDNCKAELAFYIGPMADFITDKILRQSSELTPQDLIEALACHIPDFNAALSFRKACYFDNGINLL